MLKNKSILIIGYDANLCLGVLYCLRNSGHRIYLLTSNRKNAAKYSRFLKKTYCYDPDDQLREMIGITKKHAIDLIMPIDEMEIRFVSANLEVLSQHAKCSLVTDPLNFDIGVNKMLLAEFLKKHDLPCPTFAHIESEDELKLAASKIGFPLLVKPVRGSFGRMIQKFSSLEELMSFYNENADTMSGYIVQPFIIGSDITCNVICKSGEVLFHTIQESPVKTGSDFSSNDTLTFHDDEKVIDIIKKMMKLLNWNGVACVDMRRMAKTESALILEINGRFWASVVSSYLKAGLNFPEIMVSLALNEHISISKQRNAEQISLKEYFRSILTNGLSLKKTKYKSYFSDPVARTLQILNN
ncbi:ATP-grasp domain-containing protein [Pedobacter duraquae]|uniref:Glutathione synthase/RimK-type ligase-like ATP-grasp enzyme n=1 Tax=Pedobacter duraquae TaxID=425511 RepID=A0A4V3C400_9SPHI|nr:ATP-grasp domain-containing protein [Pedobacter duraquae]TDO24058.1 glutathione synthase/RimK-type ligase-like ATP-grasp enzyme [Pedobacter duraquae]